MDCVMERLQGRLLPIARLINQLPSSHGNNNEWVTVYRFHWQDDWGDPREFVLGEEGNKSPRWLSLEEIMQSLEKPMGINAAMRLFLRRRDILVPLMNVPNLYQYFRHLLRKFRLRSKD